MQTINCSSDFPLQLLMEMKKDHPEILKTTQFVITLTGEQFIQIAEMTQKLAEANLERYFERLRRDDISLHYVTTKELNEVYHISPARANELQKQNVLTDIIKLGRQNAYRRSQVIDYLTTHKHHKYG